MKTIFSTLCSRRSDRAAMPRWRRGFTLTEAMVVLVIVSLFVALATGNVKSMLSRHAFKAELQSFISTLEMAATSASQNNKRYEVIIDITQQAYMLREITSSDLSTVLEEEVVIEEQFGENCWVSYVVFADAEFANEGRVKFRASRSGWQWGGIIVFLDQDGQPYSVVVNQLTNIVNVQMGEAQILWPKSSEELPF